MRKFFLLSLFALIFSIRGSGQGLVYHHLLDTVNIWHYTYNLCFVVPPPNENNGHSVAICGDPTWRGIVWTGADSVYNNITYKVLSVDKNTSWTQQVGSCFLGLIREDTLAGKVYYLPGRVTLETLLYNFNAQIGDTMPITFVDSVPGYF